MSLQDQVTNYQPSFRGATYCTMKVKTVKEGGQAVIFNYLGEGRLVEGPCRVGTATNTANTHRKL